jgi:ornithine cyclodeaminase/alanine dehydrogenase-like protein (mu-crystallin family)
VEPLDYKELGETIRAVYTHSDKYQLSKDVPTFKMNGKYVGDFFNFTMFEPDGDKPPTFYHIFSPYDIISGKSTQQAAAFRSGEMIMNTNFTQYMQQRTGVMSSLIISALGFKDLSDKHVIYIGTGALAKADLQSLKTHFPTLKTVSYINKSSEATDFTRLTDTLGVTTVQGNLDTIGTFDIIICHTSSKEPVLTAAMQASIKPGAVILAFSSEDFTEIATEYFDSQRARILVDWAQTIQEAPELRSAVEQGFAKTAEIIELKDLFKNGLPESQAKSYTIYRSHGTPMQNLAAMQLLLKRHNH